MTYFTCSCCELTYDENVSETLRCTTCREHYYIQGEDSARWESRLTHHANVTRDRYVAVKAAADDMEERMRSALRSRDRWKFVIVKMLEQHEPSATGRCSCGKQDPCPTIRALRENGGRGISDEVERLLTMMPKRQEYELFGRYKAERWERDEMLVAAMEEEEAARANKAQ